MRRYFRPLILIAILVALAGTILGVQKITIGEFERGGDTILGLNFGLDLQGGSDLRYNMSVSLQEAFSGKKSQIRIPSYEGCDLCSGSGSADKSGPSTCSSCNGHGKVRSTSGFFSIERPCPSCGGEGSSIKNPCLKCSGTGRIKKQKTISVNIPAGVDTGTRIRVSGEGEPGQRGASSGDL